MKWGLNWVKLSSNLEPKLRTQPYVTHMLFWPIDYRLWVWTCHCLTISVGILLPSAICMLPFSKFPSLLNNNNCLRTRSLHGDSGKLPWSPDHTETHRYRRNYTLGSVVRLCIMHGHLAIISNLKEVQLCPFRWKVTDDSTSNNWLKMGRTSNGFAGNTCLAMYFRVIGCLH